MRKYILLIFLGATCMLRCMELVTEESLFKNRVNYKEYKPAILKMAKVARRNCNFKPIQKLVCAMNENRPIDEIIKKFKNKKNIIPYRENRCEYGAPRLEVNKMQDTEIIKELLSCKVKIPNDPKFVFKIVESASLGVLEVLKKQVNFDDPELLHVALKTGKLARINFILDQQKDTIKQNSEDYSVILNLVSNTKYKLDILKTLFLSDKEEELEVVKAMYTHLLNVRNGNIQSLEDFIISFDKDMQQLQKTKTACESSNKEAVDNIINDEEIISVAHKYPKSLDKLIENNDRSNKIEKAFKKYENHAHWLGKINLGLGSSAGLVYQFFDVRNIGNSNFNIAVGGLLGLLWYSKELYVHFKKRNEKYLSAQNIVNSYKPSIYLRGYLVGRGGKENDQQIEDWQEQYYEKNIYKKKWLDEAIYLMLLPLGFAIPMLLTSIRVLFSDKDNIEIADASDFAKGLLVSSISLLPFLGKMIEIITESRDSTYFFITNNNSANLLRCVYNRGLRAGYEKYLEMNQIQKQPKNEQISSKKPIPFRGFFGSILAYSKNLFAGLVSCIPTFA